MNEIADTSQTTEGSTPSSTTPSTGDSTALVEPVYHSKKWQYDELKKILNVSVRRLASRHWNQLKYGKTQAKKDAALKFFHTEFPGRSPYAVYHKAYHLYRKGLKTIVLLGRDE